MAWLRRVVFAVGVLGGVWTARPAAIIGTTAQPRDTAPREVRALWVTRSSLTTPAAIATLVTTARAQGFNTLLVQVRGRGDAYFASTLEPRAADLTRQPADFDPLAAVLAEARPHGIRVHAWISLNLVSSAAELPASPDHLVYRHPEWLMVPRALADDLAKVDPHSPEYLGRLSRYARTRPHDVEGLYLSPVPAGAAAHTVDVVRDIARRYDVDGVHLDYIRYPGDDFDYGRETVSAFENAVPAAQRSAERWRAFRAGRLTALLVRLRDAVKDARPSAVVSAAVTPDPAEAAAHKLQEWRTWLSRDLIDVVCPMAYTTDASVFASQMAAARELAGDHPVWAGIGAYRLSPTQIADNVQTARRVGASGVILFSYDSLTDPSRGPDYLARVARAAFTTQ